MRNVRKVFGPEIMTVGGLAIPTGPNICGEPSFAKGDRVLICVTSTNGGTLAEHNGKKGTVLHRQFDSHMVRLDDGQKVRFGRGQLLKL